MGSLTSCLLSNRPSAADERALKESTQRLVDTGIPEEQAALQALDALLTEAETDLRAVVAQIQERGAGVVKVVEGSSAKGASPIAAAAAEAATSPKNDKPEPTPAQNADPVDWDAMPRTKKEALLLANFGKDTDAVERYATRKWSSFTVGEKSQLTRWMAAPVANPIAAAPKPTKLNSMSRTVEGVRGKRVRDSRGEGIILGPNSLDDSFNVRWVTGDYAGEEQRITLGDAAEVEVLDPTAPYDAAAFKQLRKQWDKADATKAAAKAAEERNRVAGEVAGMEARAREAKPLLDQARAGSAEAQAAAEAYLEGDIDLDELKTLLREDATTEQPKAKPEAAKSAEKGDAPDNSNKRHTIKASDVLTPGGALKADAYNSRAPSAVWWNQGDVNHIQFAAKVIDSSNDTEQARARREKAAAEWARIVAARKAGWSLRSYRAGSFGSVWAFEKDGKLLTRAGLENIANDVFARPDMPADEPGFESLARQQIAIAKAFVAWVDTLAESMQANLSVVSRKIGETPIGEWARIQDDGYGNKALRYYAPNNDGAGAHGGWRIQIGLGLDTDWEQSLAYLRALASKADAVGTKDAYFLLADAKKEAGIVFDVSERNRLEREEAAKARPPTAEPSAPAPAKPATPGTTESEAQADLFTRLRSGEASLEDYRAGFQRLRDKQDAIKAELAALPKAVLVRLGGMGARLSETKESLVSRAYGAMQSRYTLGRTVSYVLGAGDGYGAALRRVVEATTAEDLAKYQSEVAAARAERAEKLEAVKDPQTLDDFRTAIRLSGKPSAAAALTPEQLARYDALQGAESRRQRADSTTARKTEVRAAGQTVDAEIVATKHTKHGHDLFVVRLAERVSREDYETLNASAKRLGGSYSSFRGAGAVPGFQFRTREAAEAFQKLAGGDTAAAKEVAQERRDAFQDDRSQSAAERLNTMADALDDRADESLGRDRKANTARRARFAASAEASANADKAKASTMRRIADAILAGTTTFLDRVRQKAQIELLDTLVENAKDTALRAELGSRYNYEEHKGKRATPEQMASATWPTYTLFRSDLAQLGRLLASIDGSKLLGQRVLKVAGDVSKAYSTFAKENFHRVARFTRADGSPAIFTTADAAEEVIRRQNFKGKAFVLQIKRGQYALVMSPELARENGLWEGNDDERLTLSPDLGAEIVEKLGRAARRSRERIDIPWQLQATHDRRRQLAGMGIETPSEMRAALREYIALRQAPAAEDTIKKLERAMVGKAKDDFDFFPTSPSVIADMLAAAEIEPDMAVLEPSAGMGHIADALRAEGIEPDVGEIASDRRELLEAKGFTLVGRDFLDMQPRVGFTYGDLFKHKDGRLGVMRGSGGMGSGRVGFIPEGATERTREWVDRDDLTGVEHRGGGYDRIIMNPPFSKRRDAQHVRHAFGLLKPGGRLVAIMGEGVFFGQDQTAKDFRAWLDTVGGTSEKLPDGSFLDPSLPVNTGVNARMVVIDKPAGVLYSLPASKAQGPGLPVAQVEALAARALAGAKGAPRVVVIDKLPEGMDPAEGWYDPDTGVVTLVASRLTSPYRALQVLAHEAIGHYGMEAITGPELWAQIIDTVYRMKDNPNHAALFTALARRGYDPSDRATFAREAVAVLTEQGVSNSIIDRLVSAFRQFARKLGFTVKFSEAEIRQQILRAARFVQNGRPSSAMERLGAPNPAPAFSRQGRVSALEDVRRRFTEATGDTPQVALTRLAGIEARKAMRAAGNLTDGPESAPYTAEQMKLLDQYERMRSPSSKYLFHTTPRANLDSIRANGLVPNSPPRFAGVGNGRVSLAANAATASYYGGADDVLLRIAKVDAADFEGDLLAGEGTYTTGQVIPPQALQVKVGKEWVPLVDGAADQTDPTAADRAAQVIGRRQLRGITAQSTAEEINATLAKLNGIKARLRDLAPNPKPSATEAPDFNDAQAIGEFWKALTQGEGIHLYGQAPAGVTDLQAIADAVAPVGQRYTFTQGETDKAGVEHWTLTTPSGREGRFEREPGGVLQLHIGDLKQDEGEGRALYMIFNTWAARNGLKALPDRGGLTPINAYRRSEMMSSSALRDGGTAHLMPDDKQRLPHWRAGDLGKPPTEADQRFNTGYLFLKNAAVTLNTVPLLDRVVFNFTTRRFEDSKGRDFSDTDFDALLSQVQAGKIGVGRSTAKRAVLTASALRQVHGQGLDHARSAGLRLLADAPGLGSELQGDDSAGNGQLRLVAPAELSNTLYSRPDPAAPAEPGDITLSDKARQTPSAILKRVAGKLTDWKPALLGAIPLNYLADFAHKNMPAIKQFIDLRMALEAFRNAKHMQYDAIAQDWLGYATVGGWKGWLGAQNDRGKELSDLMHDSTIAGIDPSLDESEYKDDAAKLAAYRILRQRWDAMPEQGQQLFATVRDAYGRQARDVEQAIEENIRKLSDFHRDMAIRDYMKALKRIDDLDVPANQKAMLREEAAEKRDRSIRAAASSVQAKLAGLRQVFESMRVEQPYFPLKRFGTFFVAVREPTGRLLSFSKFETSAAANAFAESHRDQGHVAHIGRDVEQARELRNIDPAFVARVDEVLAGLQEDGGPSLGERFVDGERVTADQADKGDRMREIRDAIYQQYLESLPDLSLRKGFIHRKKTPGYHPDALRSFSSVMFHGSYQLARLKYSVDLQAALAAAEDQAEMHDPVEGAALVSELGMRMAWIQNPQGGKAAQIATSAAFVWYLGANPAHLFLNATQTIMLGIPILGSRYGFTKTSAALQKAAADFVRAKGHVEKALTGDERKAMDFFIASGLIDKTQSHDLAGVGDTGAEYSALRSRVMAKIGWFFHQSERFNREVTALAAYRLARQSGKPHDTAVKIASDQTWTIHFDYSASGRARYMQGDAMKVLTVFRNYNVQMLYRLFRDIHTALRGETKAAKIEAGKQLGAMMGMYGLMAGVTGMPFYGLLLVLASALDDPDEPWDAETRMKQGIVDLLGEDAAGVLLRGVPGSLVGVDLSERIGMPNLWFRSPDRELEGRDYYYHLLEQLSGAAFGIPKAILTGIQQVHEGNVGRGVETMMPNMLKSPVKALRYAMDGQETTLAGDTLAKLDSGDVVTRALGFTPATLAQQYDANRDLKNAESKVVNRRVMLLNRFYLARQAGDDEDKAEALAAIRRFNATNPAFAITGDTIRASLRARLRNDALSAGGIVLTPRLRALVADREATD